jgi:site-specific recombinase XerD
MVDGFLRAGAGKNRSPETIRADRTDLNRFLFWLRDENALIVSPADVPREDVLDFLGKPAHCSLSGISCRRKLAAVCECVRYAKQIKAIAENPTDAIDTPKGEERGRN